jgi:2,3-bisphosphoglycerate-independent phosphoglycerate mutase
MKYVVLLGEGISDAPLPGLGGKTPLEVARTPHLDHMASRGLLGLTRIAEPATAAGGAGGVFAVLGYDPAVHPSAYGPLDAAGLGLTLGPQDVAFRVDLVTFVANESGVELLRDATGARLPAADARTLTGDLAASLAHEGLELYPAYGARLVLVWRGGDTGLRTTPAYALFDKPVVDRQPTGPHAEVLRELIARSRQLLASHPLCTAARAAGDVPPIAIWPWGEGQAVHLPPLRDRHGVTGVVVATDPFVRGAGVATGLRVAAVAPDADAPTLVASGLAALADADVLVLHDGAAATASLAGDVPRKIAAIERFDAEVVGSLLAGLRECGDAWRVLVMPDVDISSSARRPTAEPVPFTVYVSTDDAKTTGASRAFHERDARDNGIFLPEAHGLMERILRH